MDKPDDADATRRTLVTAGGIGLASMLVGAGANAATRTPGPAPIDIGNVAGGKLDFPAIHADSELPDAPPPNADAPARRVGFAIMGLGRLATENILPAFGESKHARPVALVSGHPDKMAAVAAQYGIAPEACYSYETFDRIRDNPAVEVVYVVLPNALHRDAVVRAARAGKHVLCEKPMAVSAAEGREMVAACRSAGKKLMIAYRCQYEVNNVEVRRRVQAGEFGRVQIVDAINTQNQGDPSQWRQSLKLAGGGSLPDVGLYCLNTTRALLGEEPVEVSAAIYTPANDPRFREVESNVSFTLRFPSGVIANCATSYSAHEHRNLRVIGDKASAEIRNAFAYSGQRLQVMRRDGKANSNAELSLPDKNQFALELDHMAECVRADRQPRTPGEEGVQDHVIMAAIYEAARTGRPVKLPRIDGRDVFRGPPPADAG